jgi:outer membrane cobalamin receptor
MLALLLCAAAAAPSGDLADLSLEDLLNTPTTVASSKATKLRETPGVVTVITRDEIRASGARDLIDVLMLVPGFSFGVDVVGAVGVAFRGNWGHEGKVLLLYDGQEMNETLYSTLQFGNHYPIANIDRVEIIRGPGSALYGGFAELAVINVITRKGNQIKGVGVRGEYGQREKDYARRDVGVTYGDAYTGALDGLTVSVDGTLGQGQRAEGQYVDIAGKSVSLQGLNATDPGFLNVAVGYKGLDVRFIFDDYRTTTIDGYADLLPSPATENFMGLYAEARYDWKIADAITLTPKLSWKRQYPWNTVGTTEDTVPILFYNKSVDRARAGVTLSWDIVPSLNLTAGDEVMYDYAQRLASAPGGEISNTTFGDGDVASYWNEAAFAQVLLETSLVNITAGARFELHQQFGPSFVPRVALTRTFDKLSVKLLVSGAFKAPGIENINVNPDITPEHTRVYEAEVGYEFSPNLAVNVNAFDVDIEAPIVYTFDTAAQTERYLNASRTGSRGVEVEARMRDTWGSVTVGYSYAAAQNNGVDVYTAGNITDVMRAMPAHKLSALGIFKISDHLTFSPSTVMMSERFGFLGDPAKPVQEVPPTVIVNAFLDWHDVFVPGLDAGVGVYNLLDEQDFFVQPYDGGHGALPAPSREALVRLEYALPL